MNNKRKNTIIWALTIILLLGFLSCGPSNPQSPRFIAVTASATVKVKPDEVVFKLAISTTDNDLSKSKDMNNLLSRKLIALCKEFKIAEKDIQSDSIQILRDFENNNKLKTKAFNGYQIRKKFKIVLRDFTKYESFYSKIIESDVTSDCKVIFTSSKYDKLLKETQRAALKKARKKAKYMAKSLKQSIGEAILIEENPDSHVQIGPGLRELNDEIESKTVLRGMLEVSTRV
ncbi:MAG: SIMPL domain-containing protein, partial [Spirochaetota bacterium]|nr:SIMPL domain-containing protein [Spirochaetota bacterium]